MKNRFDYKSILNYKKIKHKRFSFFIPKINQGDKVLELGIGNHNYFMEYASSDVTLVDFDEELVSRYPNAVYGDFEESLDFFDNSFDVVVAGEVIEHLKHNDQLLDEIKRILKPGGLFLGSTPNGFNYRERLYHLFGHTYNHPFKTDHVRFYHLKHIRDALKDRFIDVKIHSSSKFTFLPNFLAGGFMWSCRKQEETFLTK